MIDVLLVGAEELENLATRYPAAVLRERGFTVELAPLSAASEREAVVRQVNELASSWACRLQAEWLAAREALWAAPDTTVAGPRQGG